MTLLLFQKSVSSFVSKHVATCCLTFVDKAVPRVLDVFFFSYLGHVTSDW